MKKILSISFVILLLLLNQVFYLTKVQFICDEKINSGKELNVYETFSALQTHSMFWILGWIVEPYTAHICFCKQFNIHNPFFEPPFPKEDDVIRNAKAKLTKDSCDKVRLTWNNYTNKTSILLNGSYMYLFIDETGDYFLYEIPCDYKPGIINICGITLSETVFDYLENKKILSSLTIYKFEKI